MIRDDSGPSFARGYLDTADQRTSGKQELEETRGSGPIHYNAPIIHSHKETHLSRQRSL